MDEDNRNPYEINSFDLNKALNVRILDSNKKRKLHSEQLGLPIPKHTCFDHRLPLEPRSTLKENEVDNLITHIIKENADKRLTEDSSDPESAKDSNSFVDDSDYAMCAYAEGKFEKAISKIWPCESLPSTSSFNLGCNNPKDAQPSADNIAAMRGTKEEITLEAKEHDYNGLQIYQTLMDPLGEFGSHLEYGCAEYENDAFEPYTDKELDDILHPDGVNPNVYILSSGRWAVDQDAVSGTRKPTIDQEFEQYFSMLML